MGLSLSNGMLWIQNTRRSAIADCTARRVWNMKRASFQLGGARRPKFYGNGVALVDRATITWPLKVFRQWNFVADFNRFWWKFLRKTKFGYLDPILGKLGVTHDLGWWLVGKLVVDFLFSLNELLRCLLRSRVMSRNVYSSAVFTGVDLFALKSYLDRVVPINHSWHQKARDTGLPDGEVLIPLRSVVLSFDTIRECDGRTDGYAVAYTAFAKL